MPHKFLRDEVANIILTDYDLREYISKIISASTGIDYDFIYNNIELDSNRINSNVNTKYSIVDAIYRTDCMYFNIEVNAYKSEVSEKKNFRYICNIILKQLPPGTKDKFRNIYQININDYDIFNQSLFVYRSTIMEERLHLKRSNFINIIDINLEYLRMLDYNIVQGEDVNSLERLLYIFICKDKNKRRELYSGDKLMDKVNEKLENLTNDFSDLYYDPIELRKEVVYELGVKEATEKRNEEIATAMLKEKISFEVIAKCTGLSIKEIEDLKDSLI